MVSHFKKEKEKKRKREKGYSEKELGVCERLGIIYTASAAHSQNFQVIHIKSAKSADCLSFVHLEDVSKMSRSMHRLSTCPCVRNPKKRIDKKGKE
jgi:hypothetical protein